jgi:ribosomal protein S18 acetylase RimI-like enzyme
MTEQAPALTFAPISSVDISDVLAMTVTAMRDNPQHIAAFGPDAATRQQKLQQMFGLMASSPGLLKHSIVAMQNGELVGICGVVAPGECQPSRSQQLRMLPQLVKLGFGPARRAMAWLGAWGRHDLPEAHWHIGPVAVALELQGQGIGSAMMAEALQVVDAANGVAYLETDKEINVAFYQRQGFVVIGEEVVIGNRNWFMRRPAQSESSLQTAA